MLNVTWPKDYPFKPPVIDLDAFCNHHVPQSLKDEIIAELNELALASSGEPLTFTLIEHIRDNMETYAQKLRESKMRPATATAQQPEEDVPSVS